jgi:hypothetical protein
MTYGRKTNGTCSHGGDRMRREGERERIDQMDAQIERKGGER